MPKEEARAAGCPSTADGRPDSWLVDSGSCFHLLAESDIPSGQKVAKLKEPVRITTANGEVVHDKRTSTYVSALDQQVTNVVTGECPPVASLGRFCIDDGMDFIWLGSQGREPVLVQGGYTHVKYDPNGKNLPLRVENYCPYLDDSSEACVGCCHTACGGAVLRPGAGHLCSPGEVVARNGGENQPFWGVDSFTGGSGKASAQYAVPFSTGGSSSSTAGAAEPHAAVGDGSCTPGGGKGPAEKPPAVKSRELKRQSGNSLDKGNNSQLQKQEPKVRAVAKDIWHLMTHRCKNCFCPVCMKVKMQRWPCRGKLPPPPSEFGT